MSKSDTNHQSCIDLTDTPDQIRAKISKATTDSIPEISYDPLKRPGVSNLLEIYSAFDALNRTPDEISKTVFSGLKNQQLKEATTNILIERLAPIKAQFEKLQNDTGYINQILDESASKASIVANETLLKAKKQLGLY
ncbi:hypothetical protein BB559_004546 [Furculomyces boomerangus]|uniref:tryptophan--tRNA ligase n=2 Tax=Harpellales TaxID=61421 RepID=A0A2T9YE10_9FUNG|nr:hypothetical protein BB559_004546 [Furculomyces boomerangus]PWA02728.1 hypothetical protein BB558_001107 [Smittium angustum]